MTYKDRDPSQWALHEGILLGSVHVIQRELGNETRYVYYTRCGLELFLDKDITIRHIKSDYEWEAELCDECTTTEVCQWKQ